MRIISAFLMSLICLQLFACSKDGDTEQTNTPVDRITTSKMKITIGSAVFTATLYDNATAKGFIALLPLTINMSELNGNEKFYDFQNGLTSSPSNPSSIQNGDIMLYGNRTLVLFYKSFPTSYSYTRIGRIDNASGLASALGATNVTVKYEMQ